MSLLNKNRASSRALIKELVSKTKATKKAEPTIKKGGSLSVRISNICEQVQKRLGHYQEQLELIQTPERLHEYIDKSIENGIIAIDTETTGLDPICDQIVGACIYTYNQKPAYIPINHISYVTNVRVPNQLTNEQVAAEFQRLVEAKTKIIMFNAKFDIRVIRHQLGVYLTPSWCGFIAGKCLKEDELEGNLKYLWKKYCSENKDEAHFTFDKMFEGIKFNLIPITTAYLYAAKDALMTMELYDFQKRYLDVNDELCQKADLTRLAKLYHEIELPIIPIVADIEDYGVALDLDYCKQLSVKYNELLEKAKDAFYLELENYSDQLISWRNTHPESKLEDPINIGSPAQLAELFYDVLQVPPVSKKKPRGTGSEELEKIGHPLCKLILDYRTQAKLLSTYIDKMPEITNKKTGRIHCSFNQYGADCVVGNSVLVTDNGFYTMENLLKDVCLESGKFYDIDLNIINKERKIEKATKAIKYENVDTIKIKGLYGYEIEGTPNHPIMVANLNTKDWAKNSSEKAKRTFWQGKHFKNLQDIQVGDYIEVPCGWNYPVKEYQVLPYEMDKLQTHKNRDLKCPKIVDEEFAEFLGMYHADGVYRYTSGSCKVSICNKDKEIYTRLQYLSSKLFGVDCSKEEAKNIENEVTLKMCLTHCKTMLDNILIKGALNKKIPDFIYKSPLNVINSYIRGLCLDSSRWANDCLNIHVRNEEDARFIQMILASQEILCSMRKSKYVYNNEKRHQYALKINPYYLPLFLDTIKPIQERKNFGIQQKHNRYKNVRLGNSFRIRVKSIEYKKNTVWDLHVPETHSFLCNSMICHNTGRFSSNNPNLQNIPSHNTDIRPMFISTRYKDIKSKNCSFYLWVDDKVQTIQGEKKSQELQVGDQLTCKQGICTITNITNEDKKYILQIDKDIEITVKRFYLIIGSDYSQQEPKITADLSNDEKFIADCASGKDAYATIASISFNQPYEECLEFYLDENGNKTTEVNKAGKQRRNEAKKILLGICYGKSIPSIAEDLNTTEDKATEIYNAVLTNIAGLKHFMDESQEMARTLGWVETKWGRRRHIPDMQLEPFEITSVGTKNFDPFFDSEELGVIDDTERLKRKYLQEISQAKYKQQKEKIKMNAEKDGFKIKENTRKIDDATRLCVNSRIQGSAADMTKIAMRLIGESQKLKDLDFNMMLLVHDEILGECPAVNAVEAEKEFISCMLGAAKDLRTGALVDPTKVCRWYGKEYDPENVDISNLIENIYNGTETGMKEAKKH